MSPQSELDLTGAQSGVFLFTMAFQEGPVMCGFLWTFLLGRTGFFFSIDFDILRWFFLSLLVGSVVQLTVYGLKRLRFYSPVTNEDLLTLFKEVKEDLGKGQRIELWFRNTDRGVFLSTTNLLFKAILFSESTIADILGKREKGKIVLAREVLMMERVNPIRGFALGLLVFMGASFSQFIFFFDLGSFAPGLLVTTTMLMFVGLLLAMILVPTVAAQRTRRIEQILEEMYRTSPQAATVEVLTGYKIPDEVVEQAKRDDAEGEASLRRKAVTRGAIAALVTTPVFFIIFVLFLPGSLSFILFPIIISAAIGLMAFLLTYAIFPLYLMTRASGKRRTEWDIPHPFAEDVRQFLSRHSGYETVAVRAVKPPSQDMFGLVVERLKPDYTEEAIYGVLPHVLKDIQDVDLVGPFILSELRRKDIEKRYNRMSYPFVGIAMLFLAVALIWYLGFQGISDFFAVFFQIMGIYLLLTIPPLVYTSNWKRRAEIKSDVEVERECPRFMEALQTLVDGHYTLPYGKTSYRTRLERIRSNLPR